MEIIKAAVRGFFSAWLIILLMAGAIFAILAANKIIQKTAKTLQKHRKNK